MNDSLELMPLELWWDVAKSDDRLWCSLSLVIRGLFSKSNSEYVRLRDYTLRKYTLEGVEYADWELNGKVHNDRGYGPARICSDGWEYYLDHGVLHRTDGPAAFHPSTGSYKYYLYGSLHRDELGGPAVETFTDSLTISEYYSDGQLHRQGGPAYSDSKGTLKYYGQGYKSRHWTKGPAVMKSDGTVKYYYSGVLHRPSRLGPAVIRSDGTMFYFHNGQLDRDHGEGPAAIWANGDIEYCREGVLYRPVEEGPAAIYLDGRSKIYRDDTHDRYHTE